MKRFAWIVLLVPGLLAGWPAAAQSDGCAAAFDDVQTFAAAVIETAAANVEDGVIAWDSADWENIVRREVGSGEFYLNNCTDPGLPLVDQPDAVAQLADMSLIRPPITALDVGGDFGEVPLQSDFTPVTQFIDLNGDGADELLLHTQVPYFSQETVYQVRGGLSIAFFYGEDGWQGQVIAPISAFVTDQTGPHVSFIMGPEDRLSVDEAYQALNIFPAPQVDVVQAGDSRLTAITLHTTTGAGEAKELAILTWDGRIPSVHLRVAFDDWCNPGRSLDWDIREDGSVFVPSNGGDPDSPLHCGRTPETLFQWDGAEYTPVESAN